MIDIFMLIMVIILMVIIVIVNIYLLAYYCAPDDNDFGAGLLCKIIAIVGMLVGLGQICLLPLDVSNTRGTGGNFRMDLIWQITYIIIFIFFFILIPLFSTIYECDPGASFCEKFSSVLCGYMTYLITTVILLVLIYLYKGEAYIPVTSLRCPILENAFVDSESEVIDSEFEKCENPNSTLFSIKISLPIALMGILCFMSYIFFSFYGGIGLFAFPLDLIYSFCTRPVKLSPARLEEAKKEIIVSAADLKDLAVQLKEMEKRGDNKRCVCSKQRRQYNDLLKQLKVGVTIIDEQYQAINIQNAASETSALNYLIQLIAGIIFLIISLLWIAQIVLYIILRPNGKPLSTFLNIPLVSLTDHNFSFLSIVIFTIFTLYLLLATIKGHLKFGLRVVCLDVVHPLKKDNTYMNSILFNVSIIMLTSVAVIQFSIKAFGEYASMTEADIIFNTQIKYYYIIYLFTKYNIFEFVILGMAFLSLIYFLIKPSDKSAFKRILYKKIQNEKSAKEQNIEMTAK